ncbi:MAG: peptidoglycan-binding protein [Herminiimonas sp.]|nr:peptidoglycan-binding protein [Herminiimonas sp.]
MYIQFFKLSQAPFSIAPDPRYLFMSERHREALAHLLYGVSSGGGFVLLTGEIGAGKTTVCRCFLEQIPADCRLAYIFNPKLTVNELLQAICDEYGIVLTTAGGPAPSVKDYVDALNNYLLASHAQGNHNVLIIDEAQNLTADVLEQLRLLTNLETSESKLLQIILIGQPELRAMLAGPEMEQLAQRIIARYHLDSLSTDETAGYIRHRLAVAGETAGNLFSGPVMQLVHRITRGVPRRINLLCDRAMLGAYTEGKHQVSRAIVKRAAKEVFGGAHAAGSVGGVMRAWRPALPGMLAGMAIAGVAIATIGGAALKEFASSPLGALEHVFADGAAITEPKRAVGVAAKPPAAGTPEQGNAASTPLRESTTLQPPVDTGLIAAKPEAAVANPNDWLNGKTIQEVSALLPELARLWGVNLANSDPCRLAQTSNLRCYTGAGGLAEIRQLDRPAILTLKDDAGQVHHVLLVGLGRTSATLRIGGKEQVASLISLERIFNGGFVTLWRSPQAFREYLKTGDQGPDVDWLAAQLARLNGARPPAANQPYDQTLARRVREFQSAHGLEIDGVAGPKTFMYLNSAAGIREPQLRVSAATNRAAREN